MTKFLFALIGYGIVMATSILVMIFGWGVEPV